MYNDYDIRVADPRYLATKEVLKGRLYVTSGMVDIAIFSQK